MAYEDTDAAGRALWVLMDCCGGHESTWEAPAGSEGEVRVLTFSSHALWCSAGQRALDSRRTL